MESAICIYGFGDLFSDVIRAIRLLRAAAARFFAAAAAPGTLSAEERAEQNLQAEKILDDYGNNILRLAYSYLHNMSDAEEILQDTLIQFLQAAPHFENETHKKAWLLHVAGNLSKNRIDYNRVRDADELNEELVSEERSDLSFVWEAVKALPVKYREVIHLFYQEGYQTAEIASILHENEVTVRSHLNRGRAKLKEVLKEAYDFA
jgi:RNA polymerase sigma factor (sigma-70 family)